MSRSFVVALVVLAAATTATDAKPAKRWPAPPPAPPPPALAYKHAAQLAATNVSAVITDPTTRLRAIVGTNLYEYAPGPGLVIDRVPTDASLPADDDHAQEIHLHAFQNLDGAVRTNLLSLKTFNMTITQFQNGVAELAVVTEKRAYTCTATIDLKSAPSGAVDAMCTPR